MPALSKVRTPALCSSKNTWTSRQRKSDRTSFTEAEDCRFSLVDLLIEDNVIQLIQLKFFNRGLESKLKNLYWQIRASLVTTLDMLLA